jgi:hypothetical protein
MAEKTTTTSRFVRPKLERRLTPQEKADLLLEHINHYARLARQNPSALNAKVPREAFDELLDAIGCLLLTEASRLAKSAGPVREFLEENPLPTPMARHLPQEFRAFCLALNALKQWVSAEQAATDRYLLGGTARARCRALAKSCMITGELLDLRDVELHHPIRDGRPPIPLSKRGHAAIENQTAGARTIPLPSTAQKLEAAATAAGPTNAPIENALRSVKGHSSWLMLQRACLEHLGHAVKHSTPQVGASSRAFARRAFKATGLDAVALLEWLNASGLCADNAAANSASAK